MPFWIKHTRDGQNYPIAKGPFATQAEADAEKTAMASPPTGNPPADLGVVVEGDLSYPHTLKHPIGKQSLPDGSWETLYSDGTTEAIP